MTHRYFSWIEDNRWQGNCLLSNGQIGNLLAQFRWRYPAFASIQRFDHEGKVISCPLYLDIDGESKEGITALKMAREVVEELEHRYGPTPDIFFSGNKGYHIVFPVEIYHSLCHYIALAMVQQLGCAGYSNIDRRVYSGRRMWRVNKSPASKDGYYKIRLTREELFTFDMVEHSQFAQVNTTEAKSDYDVSKFNKDRWNEDLSLATKQFNKKTQEYNITDTGRPIRPWTNCLAGLMSTPAIEGERAFTAFILGRWFMQAGHAESEAEEEFFKWEHWQAFETEERGITKMLRSLYRSGKIPSLGCKFPGNDRDLMKKHCDPLCIYNDDWSLFV